MRSIVLLVILLLFTGCQSSDIDKTNQSSQDEMTIVEEQTTIKEEQAETQNAVESTSTSKKTDEALTDETSQDSKDSRADSEEISKDLKPFEVIEVDKYKEYDTLNEWDNWSIFKNRYSYLGYVHTEDTSHYYDPNEVFFYSSAAANDYDLTTAWVEGVEGYGKGESITYTITPQSDSIVKSVDIINGYTKTEALWQKNSRVAELEMKIGGDVYLLHLEDTMDVQRFMLPEVHTVNETTVQFTIKQVYEGDVYEDTALTEIHFTGSRDDVEDCILEQGIYTTTTSMESVTVGNTFYIAENNIDIHVSATRAIDKISLNEIIESSMKSGKGKWLLEWIDDQNAVLHLTELEEEVYYIDFYQLKDLYGITLFPAQSNKYGVSSSIHFAVREQNKLSTIKLETGEVNTDVSVSFGNMVYTPNLINPYNGDMIYMDGEGDPEMSSEYIPVVYKDGQWWSFTDVDHKYPNDGDEIRFLGSDFLLHTEHLYNSDYEYVRTLEVEGIVVGATQAPVTKDYYIFAGDFREPMTVYVYDSSMAELKETFSVPVAYFYDGCSCHLYGMPINADFIDDTRIVFDGWPANGESGNGGMGYNSNVSVFTVDIHTKEVEKIIKFGEVRAVLGEGHILVASKTKSNSYDLTYEIVNLAGEKQYVIEPLERSDVSSDDYYAYAYGMDVYHTEAHIVFSIKDTVYIYNKITDELKTVLYDNEVKLLGIYDGHAYVNY